MYRCKNVFRVCALLLVLCLALLVSACDGQAASGPADLAPTLCHSIYDVGLFYITIENRGNDAGPSTMTVIYNTASPSMPRVLLKVKTPAIPAGNEFWLTVELPTAPGSGGFVKPVGLITITADAMYALPEKNRADQTYVTYCKDGR